ncbi:CTD small phosphatase-like protein 2 isoform X1 [Morus notabilis]|nr:CTD small phosphatase-like protein 2 isoform X1 [Morus notabilis]XP_024024342.1 CTD small phosphatase-like protein 2 isoform X1 [Morus notabilis]
MPSLKMKTQSSTGCLREKNGLRICQKSSIISKKACSPVRVPECTADLDACLQNCQDVYTSIQVSAKDIACHEEVDYYREFLDEENSLFLKQSCDSTTMGRMESSHACQSNLETIFSPSLESVEFHSEANIGNDAVGSEKYPSTSWSGADDSDENRSSDDYQSCDVSDFYISDMIVTSFPFNGNAFDDTSETNCFSNYKHSEPNVLFDVSEKYMVLPLLEDSIRSSNCNDEKSCEQAIVDPNNSGLFLAIEQIRPCDQDTAVNSSDSDQAECFDPQLFIRNLPELSDVVSNFQRNELPEDIPKRKLITLVLDLDETLVHSTLDPCDDADFTFTVFFNMKEHTVYVRKRPYLRTFLERVAEMFEVVIFTASQSIYAEQLLDILDPDQKLISRRVYRESCIFSDGSYTKDLTVLGVDLAKVAIIDNSPQVFRLQVNNGIPIKSWFDDPADRALIALLPFLETLVDADDVRPIIAKKFGNKE